jgi:hypothetical protein
MPPKKATTATAKPAKETTPKKAVTKDKNGDGR